MKQVAELGSGVQILKLAKWFVDEPDVLTSQF